jgi:hypothetical protein
MKFEFKLIFVNRKTLKPAYDPDTAQPQFVVDIDELYRTQYLVNPRTGIQNIMGDEADKSITPDVTAQCFAEYYGADVYYREVGTKQWRCVLFQVQTEEKS